ncbi:3-(3-hydroxyphenyl)propionate hydroxylase [Klebsiella michiganensis]|nr:3-(3-hydroxyphenyl)propionate hydroxylase [Klebsiella michiganensis]
MSKLARWRAVGVRFIQVVPEVQIHCDQDNVPGVIRVGDTQNRLKSWFAQARYRNCRGASGPLRRHRGHPANPEQKARCAGEQDAAGFRAGGNND